MTSITICNIIGWILLLISWFPGLFTKNKDTRRRIGFAASGLALGIFIANGIHIFHG
jgi:hypothetical protein